MKRIALILVVLLAILAMDSTAQGTVTTAVPFLLISPNSRAGAVGETGVGLADDAWATYWNPAGFAFQQGSEIAMSRADWLPAFNLSDLWIMHGVFRMPMEELDGVLGFGLTYLNLGKFIQTSTSPTPIGEFSGYEFAVTAGYGTKVLTTLGLGVNVRIIHSRLAPTTALEAGTGAATGFSFDLGLLYKPETVIIPFTDIDLGRRLGLGLNISNIGPKLTYIDKDQADPLPMNLRLGVALKIMESDYNNMTWTADFNRLLVKKDTSGGSDEFYKAFFTTWTGSSFSQQMKQFNFGMGLEYWYGAPKLIALRAGYFWEDPSAGNRRYMTFGGGLRWDQIGFDFSYISAFEDQHPLGGTLRFSISYVWGGGGL